MKLSLTPTEQLNFAAREDWRSRVAAYMTQKTGVAVSETAVLRFANEACCALNAVSVIFKGMRPQFVPLSVLGTVFKRVKEAVVETVIEAAEAVTEAVETAVEAAVETVKEVVEAAIAPVANRFEKCRNIFDLFVELGGVFDKHTPVYDAEKQAVEDLVHHWDLVDWINIQIMTCVKQGAAKNRSHAAKRVRQRARDLMVYPTMVSQKEAGWFIYGRLRGLDYIRS